MKPRHPYWLLSSHRIFTATLAAATLTILLVWFIGLRQEWSLFKDSLISTTILAVALFSFVTFGLWSGVKLRDTLGRISTPERIKRVSFPDALEFPDVSNAHFDVGEGCGGAILAGLLWLLVAVAAVLLLWIFAALLWLVFLVFAAMLYWIFFRALRLVFRHSAQCKGQLARSAGYGLGYTLLYTGWLYAIVLAAHYLR